MYRAYLRPPWPLYQTAAGLLTPLVIWGAVALWSHRLPELERLYLGDYLRATLTPDLSALTRLLDFGSRKPSGTETQVVICYTIRGQEVPAVGELKLTLHPHPAIVSMTRGTYGSWLRTNIYGRRWPVELLMRPLLLGFAFAAALWTTAWFLDQERHLEFRASGRQLRGPVMRSRAEFRRAVKGVGIGWRTEGRRSPGEWVLSFWYALRVRSWRELIRGRLVKFIRIAPELETHHVQMIGDTGSGKTQAILHVTDEAEAVGETCVIYDPHREFITRYYRPDRGDVILNSTDARCAHWDPSYEIDYTDQTSAEATSLAMAASLYPGSPQRRDWFFTNAARLILQHCMVHYRPNARELAQLMTHAKPLIDAISKGTELEEMLKENAESQRAGIISTLTAPVFALRQVPEPEGERTTWSAREWTKTRKGWVFLTSTQDTRAALRPLQSLWIDSLILRLLSMGEVKELPRVRMILDELPTLQELSQLKSALTEARKSGLTIVVGFQGRSGIKAIYGEEAEGIFSAPYTKIILRTGEAEAAEWASKMIGDREMERIREHRGEKGERTYTTEQRMERVVLPAELAGLEPRCGYLRYGNEIVALKIALADKRSPIAESYLQLTGEGVPTLPMPNLDELRRKEEQERQSKAEQAAAFVYRPASKRAKKGPAEKEGTCPQES
ncbi:MAG: type IV secretion system DNA-binding domain-containing protein [Acidobacteriaceae bacterium]|nr:type IV secretion system DNA-binding domain-containing protein [Acidobacteriaceae bacterium]